MSIRTFTLTGFDEDGVRESGEDNLRIVCLIHGGGKLVIWGSKGNQRNIATVQSAGMPCGVECECRTPSEWAIKKGHTYWVPENWRLRVTATSESSQRASHNPN
jgi:hypothetical protein